jgi:site-specific DNA-methyltransferase (adenine-specific)
MSIHGGMITSKAAFRRHKHRHRSVTKDFRPQHLFDAARRPLRLHESILIFTGKQFRGTTYNPQMVEGKPHLRGKKKIKCDHYGGQKGSVPIIETNLYYPKSILRFNRPVKSLHPTQKPLELMEWLVRTYSNRNEAILEPFAGSGSTMLAALKNGRQCIGIEQDERYCEIIAKRLEARI